MAGGKNKSNYSFKDYTRVMIPVAALIMTEMIIFSGSIVWLVM